MKRPHECQARQYGDQMICAPCGLTWDTNDPEPPECRKNIKRADARVAKKFGVNPESIYQSEWYKDWIAE